MLIRHNILITIVPTKRVRLIDGTQTIIVLYNIKTFRFPLHCTNVLVLNTNCASTCRGLIGIFMRKYVSLQTLQ